MHQIDRSYSFEKYSQQPLIIILIILIKHPHSNLNNTTEKCPKILTNRNYIKSHFLSPISLFIIKIIFFIHYKKKKEKGIHFVSNALLQFIISFNLSDQWNWNGNGSFRSELPCCSFNIPIDRTRVFFFFFSFSLPFSLLSRFRDRDSVSRISTGRRNKLERMKVVHERSSFVSSNVPLPSTESGRGSRLFLESRTNAVLTTHAFFHYHHPRSLSLLHLWRDEEIMALSLFLSLDFTLSIELDFKFFFFLSRERERIGDVRRK